MTAKKEGATVGRDTVMTPEVVEKLEKAFTNSFTDAQACLYVGIDKKTLYNYCEKNPSFSTKKEVLKRTPDLKAKMNILDALNSKDPIVNLPTSKWWAERKIKDEFSLRTEQTGKDGGAIEANLTFSQKEIRRKADEMRGIKEKEEKTEPL